MTMINGLGVLPFWGCDENPGANPEKETKETCDDLFIRLQHTIDGVIADKPQPRPGDTAVHQTDDTMWRYRMRKTAIDIARQLSESTCRNTQDPAIKTQIEGLLSRAEHLIYQSMQETGYSPEHYAAAEAYIELASYMCKVPFIKVKQIMFTP